MLEGHHLISSLISPVTISRSRNLPRVQSSLEHLEPTYLKLFYSKTGNVSASNGIDYCARRQLTAPLRHLLAVLKQFFSKTVCNVTGLGSIKTYETYCQQRTMHHFEKKHNPAMTVAASIHFHFASFP